MVSSLQIVPNVSRIWGGGKDGKSTPVRTSNISIICIFMKGPSPEIQMIYPCLQRLWFLSALNLHKLSVKYLLRWYNSNFGFALLKFAIVYWKISLNKCDYVVYHFNVSSHFIALLMIYYLLFILLLAIYFIYVFIYIYLYLCILNYGIDVRQKENLSNFLIRVQSGW